MAGLAGFAVQMGHKVTGQDKAYYPPMSNQLKNLGIKENISEDVVNDITLDWRERSILERVNQKNSLKPLRR